MAIRMTQRKLLHVIHRCSVLLTLCSRPNLTSLLVWAVVMAFLVSFVMAYLLGGKSVGESNKISFQEFLGEVQTLRVLPLH